MAAEYDDFYRHYEPFVSAFVERRVPIDSVPDLVSEVFVVAWRRRHDLPESALPWLYRTARNIIGDSYRSAERLRELHRRLAAVPVEATGDPGIVATDRSALFDALSALDDRDREILLLAAWEGLESDAIGAVFGISAGSAAVRLHRARRRLEKLIVDSDQDLVKEQ